MHKMKQHKKTKKTKKKERSQKQLTNHKGSLLCTFILDAAMYECTTVCMCA